MVDVKLGLEKVEFGEARLPRWLQLREQVLCVADLRVRTCGPVLELVDSSRQKRVFRQVMTEIDHRLKSLSGGRAWRGTRGRGLHTWPAS